MRGSKGGDVGGMCKGRWTFSRGVAKFVCPADRRHEHCLPPQPTHQTCSRTDGWMGGRCRQGRGDGSYRSEAKGALSGGSEHSGASTVQPTNRPSQGPFPLQAARRLTGSTHTHSCLLQGQAGRRTTAPTAGSRAGANCWPTSEVALTTPAPCPLPPQPRCASRQTLIECLSGPWCQLQGVRRGGIGSAPNGGGRTCRRQAPRAAKRVLICTQKSLWAAASSGKHGRRARAAVPLGGRWCSGGAAAVLSPPGSKVGQAHSGGGVGRQQNLMRDGGKRLPDRRCATLACASAGHRFGAPDMPGSIAGA